MGAIKQFIFLRKDLSGYSRGALVAQGSHASVLAIHLFHSHPETMAYLEQLMDMTTIVYQIREDELGRVKDSLKSMEVGFVEWMEGPVPTCISTRPTDPGNHQGFPEFTREFKLFC